MNSYFLIRTVSDPKIIGVKNGGAQIELIQEGERYRSLKVFFDVFKFWDKTDFSLPDSLALTKQYGRLVKGARLTDFLDFSPYLITCHFIVRARVKLLLEQFVLPEHYFIPLEIFNNEGMIELCYLFYMPDLSFDVIDFSNSNFYTGGMFTEKKRVLVSSREEYSDLLGRNPTMGRDKIVLTDKFDSRLDLFSTRLADMFVSERLKQRLLSESLTAIRIFDQDYLTCVSAS